MEIAGENPLNSGSPRQGGAPRLSARVCGVPTSIDSALRLIAAERDKRGQPVFRMQTSLVTTILPQDAQDFANGKLLSEHRLAEPGPLLGDPELRQAIAESRQDLFRTKLTADNVIITGGARHALIAAVMSTTDTGAEVILMPPFFGRYPGIVQVTGAVPRIVPLDRRNSFQPDIGAVTSEWNPMTRAILIASPNNPTGTAMTAPNIDRLQILAKRNGGFLILDETFEAFNFGARGNKPRLDIKNSILIGSFSETFSIPDLRVGYLIASSPVTERVGELGNYFSLGTPMCVQKLAVKLLDHREPHLEAVLPMIQERHAFMSRALLNNPAIESVYGDSGTFVWAIPTKQRAIDCRATVLHLAREHGLLIKPGAEYGAPGCFRIGLGQIESPDGFKRACEILNEFSGWRYHRTAASAVTNEDVSAAHGWGNELAHPPKIAWKRVSREPPRSHP